MLTYIYFVKCPGCEDEHFDFFNDAKDFAMGCLAQKPIITQIEVDRNDFGECTDSCDLGTVWSWEEAIGKTEAEPAKSIFTKDDLKNLPTDPDPEFAALDNSVDFEIDTISDDTRKPVPEGMTIEQLVEKMEENEDDVECRSCGELFDKSECVHDRDYGWLCTRCQRAVEDHGGDIVLSEPSLEEAYDPNKQVELEYKDMTVTITTRVIPATRLDPEEYEEEDVTQDFTYKVDADEVADVIWENFISEDDAKSVVGGLDTLEDDDEWKAFLNNNFDKLVHKYYEGLLIYYKEDAEEAAKEEFQDDYARTHDDGPDPDTAYDEWRDSQYFDESCPRRPVKEELKWHTYKITYTTAANPDKEQTTMFKTWKFDVEYAWRMSRESIPHSTIKRIELIEELQESIDPHDLVELEYPSLTVTLYGEKRAEDDWDEVEHTDSHVFLVPKVEVATAIWENWITEEDVKDVEGGLETLEDDKAWEKFLETHFDGLFEKYNKQILDYFEKEATEDFRERSQEEYQMNTWTAKHKPFLEEFDDAETHKANLTDCPECGTRSYDMKEQYCTNCGLNL